MPSHVFLVPTLKIYSSSNTTLEGQPLTLNCSTSQTGVVIKWLFNGTEISLDDERYMFAPAGLNTMITIINPNVSESGDYSCVIDVNSDTDIGDDTVITIFPGMSVATGRSVSTVEIAVHTYHNILCVSH